LGKDSQSEGSNNYIEVIRFYLLTITSIVLTRVHLYLNKRTLYQKNVIPPFVWNNIVINIFILLDNRAKDWTFKLGISSLILSLKYEPNLEKFQSEENKIKNSKSSW